LAQHLKHDLHFQEMQLGQAILSSASWRYHDLTPRGSGNDQTLHAVMLERCGLEKYRTKGGSAPTLFLAASPGEVEQGSQYELALHWFKTFLSAQSPSTMEAFVAASSWATLNRQPPEPALAPHQ
jgi:hypothetical protein